MRFSTAQLAALIARQNRLSGGQAPSPNGAPPIRESAPSALADIVVNERYWWRWAGDQIKSAVSGRLAAAETLKTTLAWFWTVYTATSILGLTLADRSLAPWQTTVVALPTVTLVLAYLSAAAAALPPDMAADPRDAEQVREAYHEAVLAKRSALKRTFVLVGLAATSVLAASLIVAFSATDEPPALSASLHLDGPSGARTLVVGGRFPSDAAVLLQVEPVSSESAFTASRELVTTNGDGQANASFAVPASGGAYAVIAEWTEDDVDHTLRMQGEVGEAFIPPP
ncbi:MAG TPA: hypothetical protein VFH62_02535 [Dehalococcoidia bacterium]|jgi:hypothetical protein|nr:hypothetical protein [Dehalococcoidia bacterium]